ncbi:Tubby protein [Hondaea fermentalgiana]|uniref:Tubby protein n=1 Tax=Hondaea fermentalgiana TaxID=2315210 RepID=A0A2R5GAP4_9STRA|nr:Tubby protein [Hondaea fermentalgiana]|eukprot:GBG28080.1 Tubby protein [Hondaea fermentalgiana]
MEGQTRLKRARTSSLDVRPLKELERPEEEDLEQRQEDLQQQRQQQQQQQAHRTLGSDHRHERTPLQQQQQQQQQRRSATSTSRPCAKKIKRVGSVVDTAVPPPALPPLLGLGSCSSDGTRSITSSTASVMSDADEYCFICMNGFSARRPRTPIPCANKCNQHPVHAKCIYEWRECKSGREHSSCPLCRGRLGEIAYVPRDRIGSHRFRNSLDARKAFLTAPVPQTAGVVRCYVRAFCAQGASTRYELFLQAPTTLRYPLGPLPSMDEPKYGDQILAISHKRPEVDDISDAQSHGPTSLDELTAQLDISMDVSAPLGTTLDRCSDAYLGHVASSFRGLEHTIYGPDDQVEVGAVRYTQNRLGRAVGPRRIHVCFPSLERAQSSRDALASRSRNNQDADRDAENALDAIVPHPERSLRSSSPKEQSPVRSTDADAYADAPGSATRHDNLHNNNYHDQRQQNDDISDEDEKQVDEDMDIENDDDNDEEDEEDDDDDDDDHDDDDDEQQQQEENENSHGNRPEDDSGLDGVHAVVAGEDEMPLLSPILPPSPLRRRRTSASRSTRSKRNREQRPNWNTRVHLPTHDDERLSASLRRAAAENTMSPAHHQQKLIFGANKTPYWLPTISAFSLDFCGRVTLPSNKNFQLMVNGSSDVALQFGKVAESPEAELFTLDVSWPLSPLQAFGVALSACDRKLLCSPI